MQAKAFGRTCLASLSMMMMVSSDISQRPSCKHVISAQIERLVEFGGILDQCFRAHVLPSVLAPYQMMALLKGLYRMRDVVYVFQKPGL